MPALRDEVIAIICEEWHKGQDREAEVNAAMISERLQKEDGSATKAEVQLELESRVPRRPGRYHTRGGTRQTGPSGRRQA